MAAVNTNFHSFAGGTNDGAYPYGSTLMLNGSTLYGMTYYGGTNNDGVVVTLSNLPPAPPPLLTIIYANNHAIVSWPASVSGWTLQTNNQLVAGAWGNLQRADYQQHHDQLTDKGEPVFPFCNNSGAETKH